MRKSKSAKSSAHYGDITNHPVVMTLTAIAGIAMGLFFIISQGDNKPIPRNEAIAYAGAFEEYEIWNNYRTIYFADGATYEVYPHTETQAFRDRMDALEKGTWLYLLINPNNQLVAEIRTETEELMNFETSQQEIDAYDNGYIAIGAFACVAGVFMILYVIGSRKSRQKEEKRQENRKTAGGCFPPLREADTAAKGRILLDTNIRGYKICYRRVGLTNELVVNGHVYDEKKALIEFEHNLLAAVDGHVIEAGYDEDGYSYILFDRTIVKQKKRWI